MQQDVFAKCARRLIPFIFILYLVNFIDRVNVGFAALTMNADLNFSPAIFGLGGGIFFLGYSLFQIPANLILDRIGARRWMFCILLAWGLISASNAFVQGPASFYTVRILLGIAEAGFFPGMVLYLTYWFPKAYRARLVTNFMIAIPFANIVGGPLSGLLLGLDGMAGLKGWQWMFLIEGLPACALAFVVLSYLPSGPKDARWLSAEEKEVIAVQLAKENSAQHQDFRSALLDLRVWALGVVYLGYAISYYGVQLWLPLIVRDMGFSNLETGFVVALAFVVAMVVMVLWSRSSDLKDERIWHVAIPALVSMTGLIVASLTGSNLVVYLSLICVLAGVMSLQGPFWTLPQSYLGGVAAAGGIALINTIGTGGGGFVGPYLMGVIRQATGGYSAAMATLAVASAMTAIVVLALGRTLAPHSAVSPART